MKTSKKAFSLLLTLCFVFASVFVLTLTASAVSPDDENVIPIGNINAYWVTQEHKDLGYETGELANIYTVNGETIASICTGYNNWLNWWNVGVFEWNEDEGAFVLTALVKPADGSGLEKGELVVPDNGFIVATHSLMNEHNSANSLLNTQEIGAKAYLFGDAANQDLSEIPAETNLIGQLYISIGIEPDPVDESSDDESEEDSDDESEEDSDDESEEDSSDTASQTSSEAASSSDNPPTGDMGMTAIIVIAVVALAGTAVIAIKKRR